MSSPGGAQQGPAQAESYIGPPVLTEEQLAKLPKDELVVRLKSREGECVRLMKDRAQLMKDVNRTLQLHLAEVRGLREVNQALQKDNQELRDLSCFLDDDRLKARKIAKEWQKFGKYTSTVMRQEVTAYQMKLYELEQKQETLLRENLELKELCLYLDDSRGQRLTEKLPQLVVPEDKLPRHPALPPPYVPEERRGTHLHTKQTNGLSTLQRGDLNRNRDTFSGLTSSHDLEAIDSGLIDAIDLGADVSHDSNSSTNSFSSNLDSVSSNIDVAPQKI
ncbi:putative Coiled-coil domain-containing protein 85C [Hypsibius exemplaris]|uniref:Coiled-coil domain-containing protein 85C n=1 Tax=Hypsibius exemplaris TaxID=2072580 RepID=A0A1W0WHP3_HYPEX|nr:putative Coiled-coil domain-containing protein 85C [Hypsibius exemplaris]